MLPASLYDSFEEFLLTPKMLDFGPLGMSGGIRRIEPAMHAPAVPHGKRFDPGRASGAPRSARSGWLCLLHPKWSRWCNDSNRGACIWNSDFNRTVGQNPRKSLKMTKIHENREVRKNFVVAPRRSRRWPGTILGISNKSACFLRVCTTRSGIFC